MAKMYGIIKIIFTVLNYPYNRYGFIVVNGETISATPTHPFYVDKLGWIRYFTK